MSSVEKHPDGTTVFVCTRGGSLGESERMNRWVADEAIKQHRCVLCMSKDHAVDRCDGTPATLAQATAILMGMVQG